MISCLHFGDQGGIFAAERQDADRQKEEEENKEDKEAEHLRRRRASMDLGAGGG